MRQTITVLSFVLLLLACPRLAAAQEPLRAQFDELVLPLVASRYTTGAVVAVVRGSRAEVWSYGKVAAGSKFTPDRQTIFPVGSVTKTFTAALLADMVGAGQVRLDEPVQDLLPRGVTVSGREGRVISLEDLATHRSGLPRIPADWEPRNPYNPYADYTTERLYASLRLPLPRAPGAAFVYSNLGTGLLGHALACRAHKDFEALLAERLLGPLGMSDTAVTLAPERIARTVQGHDLEGTPTPRWDWNVLAPCGGLSSTADDMVRFLRAAMAVDGSRTGKALALSTTPRRDSLPGWKIGLSWQVDPSGTIAWHDGGTYGSYSFVGFNRKTGVGFVLLTNSSLWQVAPLLERLQGILQGREAKRLRFPRIARVDAAVLADFAGEYEMEGGKVMVVAVEDGTLTLGPREAGARSVLYASSPSDFFVLEVEDLTVTFTRGTNGKVTGIVVHRPEGDRRWRRKP